MAPVSPTGDQVTVMWLRQETASPKQFHLAAKAKEGDDFKHRTEDIQQPSFFWTLKISPEVYEQRQWLKLTSFIRLDTKVQRSVTGIKPGLRKGTFSISKTMAPTCRILLYRQ